MAALLEKMKEIASVVPVSPSDGDAWGCGRSLCGIPSGYVKIAIENGHRNSEFYH